MKQKRQKLDHLDLVHEYSGNKSKSSLPLLKYLDPFYPGKAQLALIKQETTKCVNHVTL